MVSGPQKEQSILALVSRRRDTAAGIYRRPRAAATRDVARGRVSARGRRSLARDWTHSRLLLLPPLFLLLLLLLPLLLLLQDVRVHRSRGGRRMSCAGGRRDDTRPRGVSRNLVGG